MDWESWGLVLWEVRWNREIGGEDVDDENDAVDYAGWM